jgi:uncharacterized damage-inducible protein DinB
MNPISGKASDVSQLFIEFSRWTLFDEYWPRMRECVESLTEEQVWWRPNAASNSVGNLLLHLNGNVRQWLITSFSNSEDPRDRPAEFAARQALPTAELIQMVDATLQEARAVLARLSEADLQRTFEIQGYKVTGLHAVYHVVEHFGIHHGQILYITKQLRGEDLGFYRELEETGRASRGSADS